MFLSTARRSLTDFVNLTIKSVQFFGCAYRGRIYVCIYRDACSFVYEYQQKKKV
jgi:hypothetical protein